MKIKGKLRDINKFVISDPIYKKDVLCRFEYDIKSKQNFEIEIDLIDYEEIYENNKFKGIDINILITNRKYIDIPNPLVEIDDEEIRYLNPLILKEEYILGVDTAMISYGINEKAEAITKNAEINPLNGMESDYSLHLGSDGRFGRVLVLKTLEDIPVLIKNDGSIGEDMGYTKENLKDYFLEQLQIKDVEIKYDNELEI